MRTVEHRARFDESVRLEKREAAKRKARAARRPRRCWP